MDDPQLPDFELAATSGTRFNLIKQDSPILVIYFYPKDSTPGCTTEASEFRDLHADFVRSESAVFGVSRDSLKSHENFKAKQQLPFDLVSDPDERLCTHFSVIKEKKLYGKTVRGIERSTFVLDGTGRVLREWRGVKAPGHARTVLDYVQSVHAQQQEKSPS